MEFEKCKATNNSNIEAIERIRVLPELECDFREKILKSVKERQYERPSIIDIGQATRSYSEEIRAASAEYKTADISEQGFDYVFDLCDEDTIPSEVFNRFNDVIALAILEHVWQPFKAAENMKKMLNTSKSTGRIWIYAPFIYAYHAPKDLTYQDYFRYTRDSFGVLFKDADRVSIWPVRGRLKSAALHAFPAYKRLIENGKLRAINTVIDWFEKIYSERSRFLQSSGYNVLIEYDSKSK